MAGLGGEVPAIRTMVSAGPQVWCRTHSPPSTRPVETGDVMYVDCCGVVNRYRNPAQLGSDRWAALIGARALLDSKPGLVVVCGTATTIDFMSASGEFRGGVILPGMGLMLRSLHQHTAALPDADGEYVETPTQTVDAIASGCQHAQAGAIERLYNLHASKERGLVCLISGGASRALAPRLTIPFELHDNLALEGLYRISQTLEG